MWLNIKWYDGNGALLREDGAYGQIHATVDGSSMVVETILDPEDPNTRIYEAHYGMDQEWASQLLGLGYSRDLALSYDRTTGIVSHTLGDLDKSLGAAFETFHFVLNNVIRNDNRIPPYGFLRSEAQTRNALPVGSPPRKGPRFVPSRSNSVMIVSSSATCVTTFSWR